MRPLLLDLCIDEDAIPLDMIIDEGHFDTRAKQELAKRRASGEKGKIVPEFAEHIRFLQNWYRSVVIPLADWTNKSGTAEQVYDAIIQGWSDAVTQHGLSQQEMATIKSRLDEVRAEWQEQPQAVVFIDKETMSQLDPEECYQLFDQANDKEGTIERIGSKRYYELVKQAKNINRVYPHKVGPHAFLTEKEHLAAVMGWWLTAGLVGSSRLGDRKPDFGSLRWVNAPDTGGTAKGRAVGISAQKRSSDASKKGPTAAGDASVSAAAGGAGHGHIMRGPTGEPMVMPSARRRRPDNEEIMRIATMVCEDVDDSWLDDDVISELTDQAQTAQAIGQMPTNQTVAQTSTKPMQSNNAIEGAKKQGGILLKQLLQQLDIIKNDQSWPKVKADLLAKLKPYFG